MKRLALICALLSLPTLAHADPCGDATYVGRGNYEMFGPTEFLAADRVRAFCKCKEDADDFEFDGGLMGFVSFICLKPGEYTVPTHPNAVPIVPVLPF